ncbi:MAG TPA: twin-arginine translocase TatA/TatE family subunit [Terracidiphilus sp.]|nr:twin-arginine translocase TatA/TatE family subunit [Terracidiphilus sp.]
MGAPPPIQLGSLGMADSLILMVMALVVFGPRRLPQIGRQIGKLMYEFRKASNDFKFQMEEELRLSEDADRRKKEEAERTRNLALNPPAPAIEAQAAIGADDQASVSAPAGTYSADAATPAPAATPAEPAAELATEAAPEPATEAASTSEETRIRYPRINPPATGEPVPAARPGTAAAPPDPVIDSGVTAEANMGAGASESARPFDAAGPVEAGAAAEPSIASPETPENPSEPKPTEPVSQHG